MPRSSSHASKSKPLGFASPCGRRRRTLRSQRSPGWRDAGGAGRNAGCLGVPEDRNVARHARERRADLLHVELETSAAVGRLRQVRDDTAHADVPALPLGRQIVGELDVGHQCSPQEPSGEPERRGTCPPQKQAPRTACGGQQSPCDYRGRERVKPQDAWQFRLPLQPGRTQHEQGYVQKHAANAGEALIKSRNARRRTTRLESRPTHQRAQCQKNTSGSICPVMSRSAATATSESSARPSIIPISGT